MPYDAGNQGALREKEGRSMRRRDFVILAALAGWPDPASAKALGLTIPPPSLPPPRR
jgi:hypothetical protein